MNAPDRYTCEDVFRKLDDYLDRELTPDDLRRVEEHLATCARCASEHRFEETFLADVRRKVSRIEAPPDLMARISAHLASLKSGEGDN